LRPYSTTGKITVNEILYNEKFHNVIFYQMLLGWSDQQEWDELNVKHARER